MEQLLTLPYPLGLVILAKTLAHWLVTGLPVVVVAPLLAITYHLPADAIGILLLSLLIGTPTLSLLGSIGAALTSGLRQSGVLLALMVGPLMLPVLMLGETGVGKELFVRRLHRLSARHGMASRWCR